MKIKNKLFSALLLLCYIPLTQAYDLRVLVNFTDSAEKRYPTKQAKGQQTNSSTIAIYAPGQCATNACIAQYSHSVASGVYTRIIALFNRANYAFQMSGVNINLVPVGFVNINQNLKTASDFKTIQDPRNNTNYKMNSFIERERFQADLISLFTVSSKKLCGLGYQLEKKIDTKNQTNYIDGAFWVNNLWYTIIGIDCSSYSTLAHEVGHSLGLGHSQITGEKGRIYDYGIGYGVQSLFNTVMAYQSDYKSNLWLDMFSSPNTTCYSPLACGEAGIADSTRALNNIAYAASQLYERCRITTKQSDIKNKLAIITCIPARFTITANFVN